jgi:monoterpene epsilon-lactone hydrolase
MSWQLVALDLYLRLTEKPRLARETSVPNARAHMELQAARFPMAPGARWTPAPLGTLPALRLDAPEGGGVLLWLHGGAFCLGSGLTHAAMVAALARRGGVGGVLPDYRLAPEHCFPAAVEDAREAWAALRAEGWPAERIVLGGDSAGGGLAFALLHGLLAAGERTPAGVLAFSPWVDLKLSGASIARLARRDAFLPARRLVEIRDLYLAGADPRDPDASPWLGRFTGGPPVLIQASLAEILLDDARMMDARLRADGVDATLELSNGVPHVWQVYHGHLPEADAALDRAAAFIRRVCPSELAR